METIANGATGYGLKAVAGRMAGMEWTAQGDAPKAMWKCYTALHIMALIKGWDKKDVALEVFGPSDPDAPVKAGKRPKVKTSKTYDNAASLAAKAINAIPHFTNQTWAEVSAMGVEDAQNAVIDCINTHMRILEVKGVNAYEPLAGLTPLMLDARKATEAAATAEAEAKQAAEAEAKQAAEAEAKQKAEEAKERTPAEAAIAALHGVASLDDLKDVFAYIVTTVDAGTVRMLHRELGAIVDNMAKAAEIIDGEAEDVTERNAPMLLVANG